MPLDMRAFGTYGFNPRARVGRDQAITMTGSYTAQVSIHAPAWGATETMSSVNMGQYVSIHAPAWGATCKPLNFCTFPCEFQSTRPRGARPIQRSLSTVLDYVSIHAPAWGATNPAVVVNSAGLCFNPRARVGRDQASLGQAGMVVVFQSTRPRGARLATQDDRTRDAQFQSTRPRGARPL